MSNARKLADNLPSVGQLGGRNIIVNGGMTIAQRSTQVTSAGAGYLTVDRFYHEVNQVGTDNLAYTTEQVTDAPSGFSKSLKLTVTTAESALEANEYGRMYYVVEGQDLQRIGYGTSACKQVTLSFYVKSSITGNFSSSIYLSASGGVIANQAYTINSANTWERKTLTFPTYTTANVPNTNAAGMYINFGLFAGSNYTTSAATFVAHTGAHLLGGQAANFAAVNGTTWQLTGVQLEIGPQATPFEHLSYNDNFLRCARYYFKHLAPVYTSKYGSNAIQTTEFPVPMRSTPSLSVVSGTAPTAFGGNSYAPYASMYVYHASTDGAAISNYQADAEL